jgi:hypothetical protein
MIGLINNGLILMGLEFSQQLIAQGIHCTLLSRSSRVSNWEKNHMNIGRAWY